MFAQFKQILGNLVRGMKKTQRKEFMVLSTAMYISKYENESSYNFAGFQLVQLVKFLMVI